MRERTGSILPMIAPSNVYPTSDAKMILIAANQDSVFKRLAEAMGRAELAEDPRYASHTARGTNQAALDSLISDWSARLDADALTEILNQHGVPNGDIYRAPEMLEDAHFKAREAIVRLVDPILGPMRMQNVAPKLSATPGEVRRTAPALGEHNEEILGGLLGLDLAERDRLAAAGVI